MDPLLLVTLERTPAVLDAWLRRFPEPLLRVTEGPDTFSPFDVVGHLIDGEEHDWIPRARVILEGNGRGRFEPFDRFRHRERNVGRTVGSLLDEFAVLRRQNLDTLAGWAIAEADLDRTAEHPALGTVTLRQLLATWAAHDLGHIAQVARVLAKQQREAVGPWRAYLPVLDDRPRPAS
jgi:hypothetical protein